MVKIKPMSVISENYRGSITKAATSYKAGVQTTSDWQEKALAGKDNYAAGIQEAITTGSREKGISRVSNQEWQTKAATLGAARIGPGMTANSDKQAARFAPFHTVIANTVLAARTTDSDTNIDNRVKPIARALRDAKKSMG